MSTDKDWERFARHDAYWSVCTADRFRKANLTDDAREEFWASGREQVRAVRELLIHVFYSSGEFDTAIDFGCGVGRVTLALAPYCKRVIGIDVSPTMLQIARENANQAGIGNVSFELGSDTPPPRRNQPI